ncbi:MAG: hypothetical protein ACOCQO_00060 [Halanaerobiaceae bacterium]
MKKNEFLSGLIVGGILGLSLAVLTYNSLNESKNSKAKEEQDNYTELKKNIKDKIKNNLPGDIENEDKIQEIEKQEDKNVVSSQNEEKSKNKDDKQKDNQTNKDNQKEKETGMEMSNIPFANTSNVQKEKESMNKKEVRNPPREVKMKAEKEGKSMGEDFADKLNFSKKISQLEEALKNLRDENTK